MHDAQTVMFGIAQEDVKKRAFVYQSFMQA